MQRALLRQLKRSIGVGDETALARLLEAARAAGAAPGCAPEIQPLLAGFGDLLARIDAAFGQYERDLELSARSLDLSSTELSAANDQLRLELKSREQVLQALRDTVRGLLPSSEEARAAPDDPETLSRYVMELVRERERSRRALDNQKFALDQHAIVSITDTAGTIVYANDKFCEISGYRREELRGANHRLVNSGVHPPEMFRDVWETIRRGQVWHGEICNRAKDGGHYWVSATIVPLLDAEGRPEQYIAILTDVTDRKAAEVKLRQAKELAEAANRAKSEFLANMSHEIRTPMNGIVGMTDLALDTPLNEEQRDYLSIVKSSSESLLSLINDILDFSKIEAGKLLIETISFDLHRVVAETLKPLGLRASEKHLELICDIAPAVPVRVLGDPGRLRQILVNLVGNAVKFTEQGEIALRAEVEQRDNDRLVLHVAVRDTGIGIAADKQRLIFEAFAQEDTSTTRKYGGTGLGLSISSRLVDLMGGRMWLESQPGWGSTFHFTVALQVDPVPLELDRRRIELQGRKILIVDDNSANRRVLLGMLANWEIEAEAVDSGTGGLARLAEKENAFDCILLDAHMPEMDGFEFASTLRTRHAATPIPPMLMLSSGAMRGDALRCQEVGIAGYFSKPIASDELLGALYRLFGQAGRAEDKPPSHLLTRHSLRESSPPLAVLLVEDHPVNQKLAIRLLEKQGHHVAVGNHGQEALDILENRRFDLILMDVQMPVMDGMEATRRIRERERRLGLPRTPVVAMTANAMEGDREACLAAGMDDYLAKPIKAKDLLQRLLAFGAGPQAVPGESGFDYGAALAEADRETIEIIAGVFLETWESDLQRLRTAVAEADPAAAGRIAHSLKGALAAFCAHPASRLAADLEAQLRAGRLPEGGSEIDRLASEIAALAKHLRTIAAAA